MLLQVCYLYYAKKAETFICNWTWIRIRFNISYILNVRCFGIKMRSKVRLRRKRCYAGMIRHTIQLIRSRDRQIYFSKYLYNKYEQKPATTNLIIEVIFIVINSKDLTRIHYVYHPRFFFVYNNICNDTK